MPLRDDDPTAVGEYVLEDRLGSGGMGVVYRARSASGRLVAIKLVHAQYRDDEEFRSRFRQEVAAVRRVSGAFTAAVVDADPEVAVTRLVEQRGFREADARARIARQASREERLARADFVIHNDGTPEELRRNTEFIIMLLKSLPPRERLEVEGEEPDDEE